MGVSIKVDALNMRSKACDGGVYIGDQVVEVPMV